MAQPSFVNGLADSPLRFQTIAQALAEAAERWPQREALVSRHQGIRLTYAQLDERARHLAAAFIGLGLKPQDRLAIWAPNCAEWLVTQLASAYAGLILVNINPAYRLAELEFALNKVGCKALVFAQRFKNSDYSGMLRQLAPELIQSTPGDLHAERLPQLRNLISLAAEPAPGCLSFHSLLQRGASSDQSVVEALQRVIQPDDAANIQFTSGTTGLPKGATLSHFNIINNAYFVGEGLRLTEADKVCIPVPLYHCFGMVMGNLACITHGSAMVYPAEWFDPKATLQAVSAEQCSVLYGVPTMFIAELEQPAFAEYDLTSLRTGIMAGSPCPAEVMRRVMRDMHMPQVTIAYGMTETSPVSFQSGLYDTVERRVSTVGRVLPHLQVKIVDSEGVVVPRGVAGELLTRGYSVMRGYWQEPELTGRAVDDSGWMHTGDLAVLDAQGYCSITGRLKDMIIRGGENIYPREVEEYLYRHPAVQAVQVFGVPDERFGEEVCAWIQLKPCANVTEEAIKEFCRGEIARHKIPKHIRFVADFPMTVTGKVQKFAMSETMQGLLRTPG
jgi:fatty-acyl-CoA synthase